MINEDEYFMSWLLRVVSWLFLLQ